MIEQETIDKLINLYLSKSSNQSIESAIKFGIQATEKLLSEKLYLQAAEAWFRQDFKSLSEVNDYLNKHLI